MRYESFPKNVTKNNIVLSAMLKANKVNGGLILNLNVKNESKIKISVDYLNCNIYIDSLRAAITETNKPFKTLLLPGEKEHYELFCNPVNSLDYFNLRHSKGDLKKSYTLKLDFIKDNNQGIFEGKTFVFDLNKEVYNDYIARYGTEAKEQLFGFGFYQDTFINSENKYLENIELSESSAGENITISNSQINIKNRLLTYESYKLEDTLYMSVLVLNNGLNKLKAKLNKFGITVSGINYTPCWISSEFFNYNAIVDSSVYIRPGDRFSIDLKFKVLGKIDQFELNTDWLLVIGKSPNVAENKLFFDELLFKQKKSDR